MLLPADFATIFIAVTIIILISCLILYFYQIIIRNHSINNDNRPLFRKWVLVTGASSGLGLELARRFYLNEGARVILAARNLDKLHLLKESLLSSSIIGGDYYGLTTEIEVCHLDLADDASIEQCARDVAQIVGDDDGGLSVLVNNAGISVRGSCQRTCMQVHKLVMQVNYFGQVMLTKLLMPSLMMQAKAEPVTCSPCVLCISSVQGRFAIPDRSAYAASKHAFQAYFDSLRAELSSGGRPLVRVLVVSPGYIRTNLSTNALTGDGRVYGKMDETTEKGMPGEQAAKAILDALKRGNVDEVILAPVNAKAAIIIRCLLPSLYHWIMTRRGAAESADGGIGDSGDEH